MADTVTVEFLQAFADAWNRHDADALARFIAEGHTPGSFTPPPEEVPGEFPLTLDLRRLI